MLHFSCYYVFIFFSSSPLKTISKFMINIYLEHQITSFFSRFFFYIIKNKNCWVFLFFIFKHYLFLVMELVNGGDLYLFRERSFNFSEEQTRSFAAQIICGIQFLHSIKIVHRFVIKVAKYIFYFCF